MLVDFMFNPLFDAVIACPDGAAPFEQHPDTARRTVWSKFTVARCSGCALAARCPTKMRKDGVQTLRFRRSKAATAIRQREQQSASFKERYKIRSGIESTNAEIKSRHGAGSLRVRGQARVTLSIQMKATAQSVKRAAQHHTWRARAEATAAREAASRALNERPAPPLPVEEAPQRNPILAPTSPICPPCAASPSSPPATPMTPMKGHILRRLRGLARRLMQSGPFVALATP